VKLNLFFFLFFGRNKKNWKFYSFYLLKSQMFKTTDHDQQNVGRMEIDSDVIIYCASTKPVLEAIHHAGTLNNNKLSLLELAQGPLLPLAPAPPLPVAVSSAKVDMPPPPPRKLQEKAEKPQHRQQQGKSFRLLDVPFYTCIQTYATFVWL
jgi:hypothetical protein